jgi:hypothetical protein
VWHPAGGKGHPGPRDPHHQSRDTFTYVCIRDDLCAELLVEASDSTRATSCGGTRVAHALSAVPMRIGAQTHHTENYRVSHITAHGKSSGDMPLLSRLLQSCCATVDVMEMATNRMPNRKPNCMHNNTQRARANTIMCETLHPVERIKTGIK